jgi:two-component system response regulator
MAKVLLVEDNEMNRDMLARYLTWEGYQVIIATNGQQAIEIAQNEEPQIVLMDLSLPIMDGWETTRQLKGLEKTRHIPVIALTAHAMVEDRDKSFAAGCDDYETKPVIFARLLGKMRALLDGRPA